jgi:hypothetical protein
MLSVLANRTYRHLFAAQVIALIGTGMMTVALGLLAFKIAGDKAGAVLGCVRAPYGPLQQSCDVERMQMIYLTCQFFWQRALRSIFDSDRAILGKIGTSLDDLQAGAEKAMRKLFDVRRLR